MDRRVTLLLALGAWLLIGCGQCVDMKFENPQDGFFVKSPNNKYKAYDPNMEKETFFLTDTHNSQLIKADFGPFEVYQSVPSIYLPDNTDWGNVTRSRHHSQIEDQDVSVHLVSTPTGPDNPELQILIHAAENPDPKARDTRFDYTMPTDPNQQWCAHIFVKYFSREISAVCVLSRAKEACLAEVVIPTDWWKSSLSYVDVFYTVSRLDYNHRCVGSNSIRTNTVFHDLGRNERIYFTNINTLTLIHNFQEKKDQFVLLYVPTKSFRTGTRFEVPVKLEAEAGLQSFVIRAKARNGLKIVSAEISAKSKWTISVDINSQQRSAMVRAFIKDSSQFTKTPWVQDIFLWWFEVEETLDSPVQDGRIIWNIEYDSDETEDMPVSRIVSHIAISADEEPVKVLPVLKVDEILNEAVLTGKHQIYPLCVYTISQAGHVEEVTDAAACHSSNKSVIKVSEDCRNVYLDGTETAGSSNVSIIVKFARQTVFTYLRVWVPETRLDIQLSDIKLSQVKGWRVPTDPQNRSPVSERSAIVEGAEDSLSRRCALRFQQALLEVYTRFHYSAGDKSVFYGNSKASFRITDLVKGRIRVSDPRIASLDQEQVINGKQPGRTEIQVLSPSGRVMAAKEIRVSKDKVVVERALVTMVTGISLEIKESKHIAGAFTGTAHLHHQLQGKYQEGVLDVVIKYSDGTLFPLKYVQPEHYHLDVITLNHHLIGITPYSSPYQPRVKALSQGKGNLLKVLLKIDNSCYKKKTSSLAATFVYVDVDIGVEKSYLERFQNDGGFLNQANGRRKIIKAHRQDDNHHVSLLRPDGEHRRQPQREQGKTHVKLPEHPSSEVRVYPIDKNDASRFEEETEGPEHEAQLQFTPISKGMTPLEIGMYVLLGMFCLAIIVFLFNCVIFVIRYRKKKVPNLNKELVTNANDWVWIGRATLERNAVTMRSPQALMPDSDFNGNHQSTLSRKDSCSEPSSASNRNSTISEYKGSECSIRITNNPLEEGELDEDGTLSALAGRSQSIESGLAVKEPQWDYEAMGMTYDQLLEYFDNLKESTA